MFKNQHSAYPRGYRGNAVLYPKQPEDQTHKFSGELEDPYQVSRPGNKLADPKPKIYQRPTVAGFNRKQITADSVTARQILLKTYIDGVKTSTHITENKIEVRDPKHELEIQIEHLDNAKRELVEQLGELKEPEKQQQIQKLIDDIELEKEQIQTKLNPNFRMEQGISQLIELIKSGAGFMRFQEERKFSDDDNEEFVPNSLDDQVEFLERLIQGNPELFGRFRGELEKLQNLQLLADERDLEKELDNANFLTEAGRNLIDLRRVFGKGDDDLKSQEVEFNNLIDDRLNGLDDDSFFKGLKEIKEDVDKVLIKKGISFSPVSKFEPELFDLDGITLNNGEIVFEDAVGFLKAVNKKYNLESLSTMKEFDKILNQIKQLNVGSGRGRTATYKWKKWIAYGIVLYKQETTMDIEPKQVVKLFDDLPEKGVNAKTVRRKLFPVKKETRK